MHGTTTLERPDRQAIAWEVARTKFEAATDAVNQLSGEIGALASAAEASCPRHDDYFSRHDMGAGSSRDRNFRACHMSLCIERSNGRTLTREESDQITADANRLVDEFEDYRVRREAAYAEYDRLEPTFDAAVDKQADARRALLEAPAPDNEALLYKITLLAKLLTDFEDEDAPAINAIHSDALRLLAAEA